MEVNRVDIVEAVRVLERCRGALAANGAPNCEAAKEATTILMHLREAVQRETRRTGQAPQ